MDTIDITNGFVSDPALEQIAGKNPALQKQVNDDPKLREFLEGTLSVEDYADYLEDAYKRHSK